MHTKKLSYAYATSPNAYRYNHGVGCWIVSESMYKTPIAVYQDNQKFDALAHFEAIDLPFNPRESFTRDHAIFKNK